MAAEPRVAEDDIFTGRTVQMTHYQARKKMLMPVGCKGMPPKVEDYTGGRITVGVYEHNSEPFEIKDNWLLEPDPRKPLPYSWKGATTFYLKNADGKEPHAPPPTTDAAGGSGR